MPYTALIRTHNSFPLVGQTVAALRAQSAPPARIVAVDSGSDPVQRRALADLVEQVVDYPDEAFNYSKAINIGIPACATPHVLIISSHVVLEEQDAIARAITEAQREKVIGFYFCDSLTERWKTQRIGRRNFSGRNGLSNTCAYLPTELVAGRPFREDVFSAEDQEWAAFFFRTRDVAMLRIEAMSMKYLNPHRNNLKFINEEISLAYFTCREKLGPVYLTSWLLRSALAFVRGRPERSRTHLKIFKELVLARFRPPVRTSKYY